MVNIANNSLYRCDNMWSWTKSRNLQYSNSLVISTFDVATLTAQVELELIST